MSDFKVDENGLLFREAVKKLKLRFPVADIVRETGYEKGNISSFLSGKKPVPTTFLQLFSEKFHINNINEFVNASSGIQEVNKLTNYKPNKDGLIPFYDVDFVAGNAFETVETQTVTPEYYMDIPDFRGCTAFRAYSDSMEGIIKSGSVLFGTKVDEWQACLEFGQIYGIVCNDGRKFLKYIRKFMESPKEYFLLQSENKFYDEFEIPKNRIRSIWLIHGHLNKRV